MKLNILPEEAKNIAKKYIKEPGAMAGNPKLKSINDEQIYLVPVILNKIIVGKIYIDSNTGENKGGMGGAPNG